MKCIIIGLGNFGMALAQRLTAMGYEVIGVDKDIDKVNAYKDSTKNTICLNLNNEQAARNLPLKDADLNIVSLGKDAGASILTVAILKQNGAKRIIVRAISTLHKTVLEAMGITEIIQLEKEYAEKMNRTRLENIYTESIPLLRQQFFTQLLTETLTEDYCTLQMKNLKLNLDYKVFHIITVKIRENDLNDVLSELSIKETIKESLEKITDLYHFGMIDREVFLLCGNKKHDIERITRTIQEASVIIERIFHTKISCGISSSGTSLRALPVLYQQALEALDYNVVIQDESYTYYNDILPLQKDAPLQKDDDWNSEVDSIEKIITHCSEEELKTAVLNMLEHLHEAHYNLNEYQIVILEISFSLARLYKKYQITSDKEFAGSKKMAVKILSLNTGEELDNWLINYFQLMRTLIQKKQVDNNVILAENAKKLVEEHFREPDLSVESICKELHVSSSYFSKIFKQETETTFLNYLISRRMEEAKMLLKMTDYKSHVIGTMVGYPEPNYFSYVFKKHCGISPVKYRKLGGENN